MTTHLVVADAHTLDRIIERATLPLIRSGLDIFCDGTAANGDRWLFRTPDVALVPTADFYYIESGSFGPPDNPRVLPLIAACDLLGIEEL